MRLMDSGLWQAKALHHMPASKQRCSPAPNSWCRQTKLLVCGSSRPYSPTFNNWLRRWRLVFIAHAADGLNWGTGLALNAAGHDLKADNLQDRPQHFK